MARKKLRIPLTLPEQDLRQMSCARCIEQRLAYRPGIRSARVIVPSTHPGDGQHQALIELDYDPDMLSLAQIDRYVQQADACLDEALAHLTLAVEGITSPRHEQVIHTVLNKVAGLTAAASYVSQTIRLEFDRTQCALPEVVRRLEQLDVHLLASQPAIRACVRDEEPPRRPRWLALGQWSDFLWREQDLAVALLAGLLLAIGFAVHIMHGPWWVRAGVLIVSYLCGAWYPAQELAHLVRRPRLNIDVLMFAAAFGAAVLGHYEEGALLLFLFSLGGAGERLAMDRARRAIGALAQLAPQTATIIGADGLQKEVKVQDLRIGDRVLVRPGERIPADGVVISGASAVDQAAITGESMPVEKTVGDEAFTGTINKEGLLTLRVDRPAGETMLSKVIRLVEEAQTTKSPTQAFTDQVEKWYVPIVILCTGGLIAIPPLLGIEPLRHHSTDWQGWFYQAMAFLTAASPCALAIGTPAAILSGIARAARAGVLAKGGAQLENLGRIDVVAFDKTGTLTQGRAQITQIVPLEPGLTEEELLALAAAIERGSRHPVAEAIVAEAEARQCPRYDVDQLTQTPGMGITGRVKGRLIAIGRVVMFPASMPGMKEARDHAAAMESQGQTTILMAADERIIGLLSLADQPRPEAAHAIQRLKHAGIRHTIMLTGDNSRTAAAVARIVGVDEYHAELFPQDKLAKVRELDQQFGHVAMVGDGVNDAPALANATVGIAIGGASGAGSDVALETADIALLSDDLGKLPDAISISRFTRRIILQNLILALGVIVVLAPLAALGRTTIYGAVIFHEGSTVLVVINALRILRHRAVDEPAAP